jgi:hypothetical protein
MPKLVPILAVSLGGGLFLAAVSRVRVRGEHGAANPTALPGCPDLRRLKEESENLELRVQQCVSQEIRLCMTEAERRLSENAGPDRLQMFNSLAEGVKIRVAERIARLDEELTGQRNAIVELRECSVKTGKSIQRLLESIERLAAAQAEATSGVARLTATEPGSEERAEQQPAVRRRRRWSLFG